MADRSSFLGTGWAFPPAFDDFGRGALLASAETDIEQSLFILLSTTPGERVMQPDYGCDLRRLVFEPLNQNTLTDIKDTITRAVRLFEPRIVLELITTDDSDAREGRLKIGLEYTVISTNTRTNMVFPLYLLEASGTGYEA
jgi:phage baseplate assembly protein W